MKTYLEMTACCLTLQVGGDVTMSRCVLSRCSPSLHTTHRETRVLLTLRSGWPLTVKSILNLCPSFPGILCPLRNSSTRPSSANRTQDEFQWTWSEKHPMMTSFPATTAILLGRVISFVSDSGRKNNIVMTVDSRSRSNCVTVRVSYGRTPSRLYLLAVASAVEFLNMLWQSIFTCKARHYVSANYHTTILVSTPCLSRMATTTAYA